MLHPCALGGCWLRLMGITAFLSAAALPANIHATRIRVSQESRAGAGDFHQHILGHIGSVASGLSVVEAYAYNTMSRFSFNGEQPVLRVDVSHLFFVDAQEGLSLFIVHDAVENPDGGSAAVRIQVDGNRANARLLLRDDGFSETDDYAVKADGSDFYAWHSWYSCCTDGVVVGPFDGPWKIYVQFIGGGEQADVVEGMRTWEAVSNSGRIRLELEKGRRVLLEPISSFVRAPRPHPTDSSIHFR